MKKSLPFVMPLFRGILFILAGVLLTALTRQSPEALSRWWSIICTVCNGITVLVMLLVFFYALQHSFMPMLWEWRHILFRFLSFIPLMLVLGIWYYKKRRLAPLMIGHAVLDIATRVQILMVSVSPAVYELMRASQK